MKDASILLIIGAVLLFVLSSYNEQTELDQFYFNWFFAALAMWCFYIALKPVKDNQNLSKMDKLLRYAHGVTGVIFLSICIWSTYYINYGNVSYANIALITHTCDKDGQVAQDCQYVASVTYRPYLRNISILTIPKYPILDCRSFEEYECKQERFMVNKSDIKSFVLLDK